MLTFVHPAVYARLIVRYVPELLHLLVRQKLKYPDRLPLFSSEDGVCVCVLFLFFLQLLVCMLNVKCTRQHACNVCLTCCIHVVQLRKPLAEIRNVSSVQFRHVAIQSGRERLMDGGREPPAAASASIGGSFLNLSQQVFPPCTS